MQSIEGNIELNLLKYFEMLWRWRWWMFIVTLLGTGYAVYFAFTQPRFYASEATLMLKSGASQGGGGNLANLLQLPGGGGSSQGELSKLTAIIKSRRFNQKMIEDLDLLPEIFWKFWDKKNKTWKNNFKPDLQKAVVVMQSLVFLETDSNIQGLLRLRIEFRSPKIAQKLVNHYTQELQKFNNENNLTLSKRERIIYGEQLVKNEKLLLELSRDLANFFSSEAYPQAKGGVLDIPLSVEALPKNLGQVLGGVFLHNGSSKQAPLNQQTSTVHVENVPVETYLEYLTGYQQILRTMQSYFHNQYELAKVNESKEDLAFQIIDFATFDPIPVRPNRKFIVLVTVFIVIAIEVFLVLLYEYILHLRREWHQLKQIRE